MFNVTNSQPNISDTSFNNLRSNDSSNQVLEENNFAMSQLHVDSRQVYSNKVLYIKILGAHSYRKNDYYILILLL